MTPERQDPNEIADELLEKIDDDDLVLYLDDDTALPVSIRRPLHLPSSVHEGVEGGSLRYAVEARADAADRLNLPAREGLIAAEEVEEGTWNRSRIEFHEATGDDDAEAFGDLALSREIRAVDA